MPCIRHQTGTHQLCRFEEPIEREERKNLHMRFN